MRRTKVIATAAILAAISAWPVGARSADVEHAHIGCADYADHLRNARAHLARSDREQALAELQRARESLRSCEEAQSGETALAARASTTYAG